jgi:hypothetical protein
MFHLSVHDAPDDPDPPTGLQVFGIYLVWALKRLDLIAEVDEDRLLTAWHAAK